VLVSGSYGGVYNAWHAVRKGAKAVILNDAGVGLNRAGISGLEWLDALGLPAATADCMTCHIGDGEHMLAHGFISFVNRRAARLGCAAGISVTQAAQLMEVAPLARVDPPAIGGGKRFVLIDGPKPVIGLDAAPLLDPSDAGAIAVTGSHAALFRGRPDNVIGVALHAAFFNDAGIGLDGAGISRLADLDRGGMIAATVSARTAEIGNARSAYETGTLSFVNATAERAGLRPGISLKQGIASLLAATSR
jgi:hypothetical protein